METFELSPDGRKSIATFRMLEAAIEQAQAMLSIRPDVGQFRIYAATGLGRRLVGSSDGNPGLFKAFGAQLCSRLELQGRYQTTSTHQVQGPGSLER